LPGSSFVVAISATAFMSRYNAKTTTSPTRTSSVSAETASAYDYVMRNVGTKRSRIGATR
jgi:hypothetical protein